jgi:alpha-1,2-mannosyltransferase
MLEYLLTIVLIIGALIYIVRSIRKKPVKKSSDKQEKFGKWIPVPFESPRLAPYPDWSIETTRPLPYRPFKYGPDYFIKMGIGRLDLNDWIELDNQWTKYHEEKLSRLSSERVSHLSKTSSEAQDAALETMELLSEYLVHRYPSLFEYQFNNQQKRIRIKTTNEIYPINSDDQRF